MNIPDNLPDNAEALTELEEAVRARFEELQAEIDGADPTEDQVDELERLVDALDDIKAKRADLEDRASRASAAAARFAAEEEPAVEEVEAEQLVDEESTPDAPEAPAEFTGKNNRRYGGTVKTKVAAKDAEPEKSLSPFSLSTNADNFVRGRVDFTALGEAMEAALRGNSGISTGSNVFAKSTFGYINREFDDAAKFTGTENIDDVIAFATDETHLDEGSLVAAGGWCAPSETLYDFLPVEQTEGLISLPEISVSRGGLRYPIEPDFAALYQHENFLWTEAEAIAGTKTKECVEIPCVDMEDRRLDAIWNCVTSNLLSNTGWPELRDRFLAESYRAFEHRKSSYVLSKIKADATTVTFPATSVLGAAGAILNSLSLQAMDIRAKFRTQRTIEALLPIWVREMIRADLAYQENALPSEITDQQIASLFSNRNINVQFLADLSPLGAATAATEWPATIEGYLYPAGSWFRAVQPVVNLSAQYSPEMLAQNKRSELFIEDGILAARRGFETRHIVIPVEVAGQIGQRVPLAPAPAPTPAPPAGGGE